MGPPDEKRTLRFQAPRGTNDVLPADEAYWRFVRDTGERICARSGYRRIETPMFEDARVFLRGAGEGSDLVEKEMYLFEDRGGERLALRPEGTANVCRAYLEHGMQALPQPVRLFYISPVFRYDRPQAGRYRQHTQLGVEAIGDGDPLVDAEVIDLLATLFDALGLRGVTLQLSSIGDPSCRLAYVEALRAYYRDRLSETCDDCRMRYEKNPMRLLDCKDERCRPVIEGAPVISDRLCEPCAAHFATLRSYLEALAIAREKPNIILEVSCWQLIYKSDPGAFVRALDNMRNEIGIERIIFGSDFPGPRMWMPLTEWVGAFRSLPALGEEHGVRFDDRDVDAILGGNSARILGL